MRAAALDRQIREDAVVFSFRVQRTSVVLLPGSEVDLSEVSSTENLSMQLWVYNLTLLFRALIFCDDVRMSRRWQTGSNRRAANRQR